MPGIPLMRPYLPPSVKDRVMQVLDSGYLTEGPVTQEFEKAVAQYTGAAHAVAVSNCTVGLEAALRCFDFSPEDEVIVPDYTFPATADAVLLAGFRLVLVDINPFTMLIDWEEVVRAITPKTKLIMPVSLFGNPLDQDRLYALQNRHGLFAIEDAACALGASFKKDRVGALSDMTVFSFHPRKFITTGEGGMITTDSGDWAERLRSYKFFGRSCGVVRETTVFHRIGTNLKLSNLQAAVGLGQMGEIEVMLARRRQLAERYQQKFAGHPGIQLPLTTPGGNHSWQSFCIQVENRNAILARLRAEGIEAQIGTYALHLQPAFAPSARIRHASKLTESKKVFERCLALPLFHEMTEAQQDEVVAAVVAAVEGRERA